MKNGKIYPQIRELHSKNKLSFNISVLHGKVFHTMWKQMWKTFNAVWKRCGKHQGDILPSACHYGLRMTKDALRICADKDIEYR